jgi:ethanolamine utilization protein EutN
MFLRLSGTSKIIFSFSRLAFDPTLLHVLIGRVIGDVVATQKVPSHEGHKILVVQPLHLDGTDRGDPVLALDAVDAGIGERVLLTTEGFSAMTAVGRPNSPIDSAVIGVIDSVDLHDD